MKNPFDVKPFSMDPFGSVPKKASTAKKTSKPAVGKKPAAKAGKELPEKKVTCPYCKMVNTFPEFNISRFCSECGKAYFRP